MHKKLVTLIIVFNFAAEMVSLLENTILNLSNIMKRHCYNLLKTVAVFLIGGGIVFSSCVQEAVDTTPSASLVSVTAGITSADVVLKTANITSYAYLLSPSGESSTTDPAVIFMTGKSGAISDGEHTITITGLEGDSEYSAVVALKTVSETYFEQLLTFDVKTKAYEEVITLVSTSMNGLSFHIEMPSEVLERNNVIRYEVASLPDYLSARQGYFRPNLDMDLLYYNSQKYCDKSATYVYDDSTIYEVDEDGNHILDEDGSEIMLHNPYSPGEPIVVFAGEFGWTEDTMFGFPGYFDPMFDTDNYYANNSGGDGPMPWSTKAGFSAMPLDEDTYWTGFHDRKLVVIDQPSELDANIDIECDIRATSGTITMTPDENVALYCVAVIEDAYYQMVLDDFLLGNESYLQWFTTSYFITAANIGLSTYFTEPTVLELTDFFGPLEPETDFHLLVTAMGDEKGTSQKFYHQQFSTKAKTLPAPQINVSAISNPNGEESPYEVWFNVKCPTQDIVEAKYGANYLREWTLAKWYESISQFLEFNSQPFTASDIAEINSEEGLNMMFTTLPGQTTRLAVIGYNEEDTYNLISGWDDPAVAEQTSTDEPVKPSVESKYFEALLGDWTMSASASKWDYYSNKFLDPEEMSCKITIMNSLKCPETLSEADYAAYPSKSKEEVDALYDGLKQEIAEFNAWLKGQNRLLCVGFGFEADSYSGYFTTKMPYELFVDSHYSAYDNNSLIWDFGPKWYLEVLENGQVVVPVNYAKQFPMSNHGGTEISLAGFGTQSDGTMGYLNMLEKYADLLFPVDLKEDNNSFVVNPAVYNGSDYYLQAACPANYGQLTYAGCRINEGISFSRGWEEVSDDVASTKAAVKSAANQNFVKSTSHVKRKTPFVNKRANYEKHNLNVITKESFEEFLKKKYETSRR